jgi:hypothetical protein
MGVQVLLVARDGIRFRLFSLGKEFGGAEKEEPEKEKGLIPVLIEAIRVRVQAASPPPARADGNPWNVVQPQEAARSATLAKLGLPNPDTIILDEEIVVPAQPAPFYFRPGGVGEPGEPTSFLANAYPQGQLRPIEFYVEDERHWTRQLEPPAWVAVSFDRFRQEGDSVALLAPVTNEWLPQRPKQEATPGAAAPGEMPESLPQPPKRKAAPDKPVRERTAPPGEMPEYIPSEGPERQWAERLLEFARRNGWSFDEAARLSVETVLFFEEQDSDGATVIVRPRLGRTRRDRRAQRSHRVRFAFKNPTLLSEPEDASSPMRR